MFSMPPVFLQPILGPFLTVSGVFSMLQASTHPKGESEVSIGKGSVCRHDSADPLAGDTKQERKLERTEWRDVASFGWR